MLPGRAQGQRKRKKDNRTEEERNRNRKERLKRFRDRCDRKYPLCIAIGCPALGQRGWCQGYCKRCAPKNGHSRPVEVQKQKKVKVKNEVKRMAETAGAEKQDARPSNVKVHPYIQLHKQYLIENRERARCEAKKTKWKRQALRKGRACARLTAAVFKMNDELMKTKQRPAAKITTNDEDSSSNEKGNDGPVSDKVDDDDFSMDKKLPKGVRICKGPVPMPRIPAREKCQGRKALASATHQVVPLQRVRLWHLPLQRTCLSPSGCGKVFCKKCYP